MKGEALNRGGFIWRECLILMYQRVVHAKSTFVLYPMYLDTTQYFRPIEELVCSEVLRVNVLKT